MTAAPVTAGLGAVLAGRLATAVAGLSALAAAGTQMVDLLYGADARWAVAADLLLLPPAVALAWAARLASGGLPAMLTALGVAVGPVGAVLGDRAGHAWWWLALELAWWSGATVAFWASRPGLSVISGAAAGSALVAVLFVGLSIPEPVASAAGIRIPLTIAWSGWLGVDLVLRYPPRQGTAGPNDG